MQLRQRCQELCVGGFAETTDADVAHTWGGAVSSIYRFNRNLATGNAIHLLGLDASTANAQLDFGAAYATQALHGAVVGNAVAHIFLAIDGDDAVASLQTHVLRRTALEHPHHADSILINGELHADARKTTAQFLHALLHLGRRDIGGVRVQFLEYLRQSLFHEIGKIDGVDILVVYEMEKVDNLVA